MKTTRINGRLFGSGNSSICTQFPEIVELYKSGLSAEQIKLRVDIPVSARSIQRYLKSLGLIRSLGDALKAGKDIHDEAIRNYWSKHRKNHVTIRHKKIAPGIRFKVMKRDNFKCVLCGNNAEHTSLCLDHVQPVMAGGLNTIENLRTLCFECNVGRNGVDYSTRKKL